MTIAKTLLPSVFLNPIFQANDVAIKFAIAPPTTSIIPKPPKKLATIVPIVMPRTEGHPKIIESGNNESAILT